MPNPRHRLWAWLAAVPAVVALGAVRGLSRPRPERLGAVARALERHAPLHLRRASSRCPAGWSSPTASRSRSRRGSPTAPSGSPARARPSSATSPPVAAPLRDGRYEFELPAADRARLARRPDRRLPRSSVRVEPTLRPELTSVVADVDAARLPRPARSRSRRTCAAARSRWSRGAGRRFAATASRDARDRPGRRPAADARRARRSPARRRRSTARARSSSAGRTRSAWRARSRSPWRSPAATTRPPIARLRGPAPAEGRARLRAAQLQGPGPGRFRRQARRHGVAGGRQTRSSRRRPRASASSRPAATTRRRSRSAARSRPSRSASSRSRSASASSPRITSPAAPRVYSPTYTFYVLNAEQHAIWLTEQLSKWHRQSLEVRDREMQLYETNKQLRALARRGARPARDPPADREPGGGRAGERPAALGPGRSSGEDLVRQAMRNPEFGVGHLEKWAEMLQILKDISGNRMPSVADLLEAGGAGAERWPRTRRATRRRWPARSGPRGAGHAGRAEAGRPKPPAGRPAGRRPRVVAAAAGRRRPAKPPPKSGSQDAPAHGCR